MVGTPAHGLWNYALYFFEAAELVNERAAGKLDIPKYYLVCHALELGLKAFLNYKGLSLKDLKNPEKFGHDLEALFGKARELGLRQAFKYTSGQWRAIRSMYGYYKGKRLEYLYRGSKTFPAYLVLKSTVEGLLCGISPPIRGRAGLR